MKKAKYVNIADTTIAEEPADTHMDHQVALSRNESQHR
jgi:hypothetical protein